MDKIRVRYSKVYKARYISHLDLITVMQRAFIRAGVSLKYTEGFNPHPYISVALPLPVGIDSICELLDVALQGGGIRNDVNCFLPEGLKIQSVYRPYRSFNDIKWADVDCAISYDGISFNNITAITEILTKRFAEQSLVITKKTKRGITSFDAAPHICDTRLSYEDGVINIRAKISAQNPTISYKDIVNIVDGTENIPKAGRVDMKRIEIYDANMVLFK